MVKVEEEPCNYEKSTLLSKYRIPVQHLDFDYVEKCNDGKELERILQILRSGEEGYFPQLTEVTEKKLSVIKPNSKLLRKVCPVLTSNDINPDDWRGLSKELKEWVDDVNKKDQELEQRKDKLSNNITNCNIRKTKETSVSPKINQNLKRIKSTDYESWDKYDPDTEILKMDLEEEKVKKEAVKNHKENTRNTKTVRFNNFATEAEATFEANCEKERGNECFKAGEFTNALQHYSNSLECKPLAAVYTNRAFIYNNLQKYDKAISDCKLALKLEPRHFKAFLRMAQSYEATEQYEEALKSVEKAIEIDPNSTTAQQIANRVRKKCGETVSKTRLTIEDVGSHSFNMKTDSQIQENYINKSTTKPLKPILKTTEKNSKLKTGKNKISSNAYEVISIPGTSKMPPPYFKIVRSTDPEVIKKERQQILNRPQLLYITTIDTESDDEDAISDSTYITNNRDVCIKTIRNLAIEIDDNFKNHKMKYNKDNNKKIIKKKHIQNSFNKSQLHQHITVKEIQHQSNTTTEIETQKDNKGAGGEPYNDNHEDLIPSADDLQSPYTFIQTWNSIRKDATFSEHAKLLRKLDTQRIHEVIGYKLDDTMLSIIITCLYKHFMVPDELNRLRRILTSITQIPRFSMILMFLNQSVLQYINQLIQFLDQHGQSLETNIKNIYINH